MRTIGLDIGTTTISAVVLDGKSREVLRSVTIENGSFIRTGREWERIQDAGHIVEKAKKVLDDLLDTYPDITSIGLTGQMHGILYVDLDGRVVSPLYTWQDGRGNLPDADGHTMAETIREVCRIPAATGYGLVTHLYNQKHGLVPKEAAALCTVGDYLGMVLTGRKRPLLHSSNAASLGFFDSRKKEFRREALQQLGMDGSMLPQVTDEFSILGSYRRIPVSVAIGDNQASFLGSVGAREQVVLLNMGTGGQISVLSNRYFEAPGIEARPFVRDQYLLVGSSLCGGRAYAILEKFLRSYVVAAGGADQPQYAVMEKLARKGQAEGHPMQVVTTFQGTRADPGQRGRISGISEENFTPESLVYGVLQGMARELYELFEVIREGTGITAAQLVASGNGLRKNKVLQEIFETFFGAELALAPYEEEAACGAAVSSMEKA